LDAEVVAEITGYIGFSIAGQEYIATKLPTITYDTRSEATSIYLIKNENKNMFCLKNWFIRNPRTLIKGPDCLSYIRIESRIKSNLKRL